MSGGNVGQLYPLRRKWKILVKKQQIIEVPVYMKAFSILFGNRFKLKKNNIFF